MDHFDPNDCSRILGLKITGHADGGSRSREIIYLEQDMCCKVYGGIDSIISYLSELDFTSRVIHPSIVKTRDVVIRTDAVCIKDLNHGLLMDYVDGSEPIDSLAFYLEAQLRALEGQRILLENGITHGDWLNLVNQVQLA